MTDIRVDPATARAVGAAVQSLGARVSAVVPAGSEDSVQPGGDENGWTAFPAMGRAGAAWLTEIRSLAQQIAAAGDALITAADGYDRSDQDSAARLSQTRMR